MTIWYSCISSPTHVFRTTPNMVAWYIFWGLKSIVDSNIDFIVCPPILLELISISLLHHKPVEKILSFISLSTACVCTGNVTDRPQERFSKTPFRIILFRSYSAKCIVQLVLLQFKVANIFGQRSMWQISSSVEYRTSHAQILHVHLKYNI